MNFLTAQQAFEFLCQDVVENGSRLGDTLFLQNVGFYIDHPLDNEILSPYRNWKKSYAEREWAWYLSGDQNVLELSKHAKIWDKMHDGSGIVNSNYGYQWMRDGQLQYLIDELKKNGDSRRAVLTLYDGKEHRSYSYDTPCTLNIIFSIHQRRLNMTVIMRSNDLWFGFCNDQYCFSKLLELVGEKLGVEPGWYYHFVHNMHLYDPQINLLNKA